MCEMSQPQSLIRSPELGDFYSMKAIFDPLVVRKIWLGTPAEIFASGETVNDADRRRAAVQKPMEELAEALARSSMPSL